jgi:hypothetical protein
MAMILIAGALCACSSTHDIKRDGQSLLGGGFIDEQEGPGLYLVKAFANISPFPTPAAAESTFRYRANQLCPQGYTELGVRAASYVAEGGPPPITLGSGVTFRADRRVTSRIGHILCNDSPLTAHEATAYLDLDDSK